MQYPVIAQPQYGFAPTFASGGLADAARAVQSRGRNNDTMLVHMTPNEVNSLQGLAMANGGTLTINPDTGLPEADFLEAILPMVAGFALGPAGFGLMSSLQAGLTVGALTGIATGDLGKGLMAGLGAYGGSNLGSAFSSTGTEAAKLSMLPEGGMSVAESIPSSMGGTGASTGSLLGDVAGKTVAGPMSVAPGTTTVASQLGINAAPVAMTPSQVAALQSTAPTGFSSVGTGVKDLFSTGGFDRFGTALTQQTGGGLGTTASLVGVGMPIANAMQPTYDFPEVAEATSNYAGPYRPTERDVRYPTLRGAEDSSEFQYFTPSNPVPGFEPMYAAAGGAIGYADGGETRADSNPSPMTGLNDRLMRQPGADYVAGQMPEFNYNFRPVGVQGRNELGMTPEQMGIFGMGDALSRTGGSNENPQGIFGRMFSRVGQQMKDSVDPYVDLSKFKYDTDSQQMVPMAQGGLAGLNAFNKGGMPKGRFLQGAGDGTSDSIPATIGGSQPARLADGEFVIDARTVSEIGNGSSKAGAKKLYAMMERVHKERKKAKRGQDSNADRYLPA